MFDFDLTNQNVYLTVVFDQSESMFDCNLTNQNVYLTVVFDQSESMFEYGF